MHLQHIYLHLCAEVDILEGRVGIQRDLDQLEVSPYVPCRVQKKQGQGPAHGFVQSKHNTGWTENELKVPLKRKTWGCWLTRRSI